MATRIGASTVIRRSYAYLENRSRILAIGHDDPADRFLVATAKVFDLTLVTPDERLIAVPGFKILAKG